MFNLFRLLITLTLIFLIVPQTTTENVLLRAFNSSGFFANYGEAKKFLIFITWFFISLYLILTFFASLY